jgi:hypothetical protein
VGSRTSQGYGDSITTGLCARISGGTGSAMPSRAVEDLRYLDAGMLGQVDQPPAFLLLDCRMRFPSRTPILLAIHTESK